METTYLDLNTCSLEAFRLASQQVYGQAGKSLNDIGVPVALTDKLFAAHERYRREIGRLELKVNYALIPRFNEWLRRAAQDHLLYRHEYAKASAFIQRINALERDLDVIRPRATRLREKLSVCAQRHKRQ